MSRQLILHMSVSMDGFVARPDRVIDWLTDRQPNGVDHGARRHRANLELIGQIGTIVMGSGAYTEFERGWSTSDNPMAKLMNSLPKLVFSESLTELTWTNAHLAGGSLEEQVPKLKEEEGGDIAIFGGARIAHSAIRHRLVDEYRLTIHPVALGDGLPLMHGLPEPQRFELVSSTAYADGAVSQVLRPT